MAVRIESKRFLFNLIIFYEEVGKVEEVDKVVIKSLIFKYKNSLLYSKIK